MSPFRYVAFAAVMVCAAAIAQEDFSEQFKSTPLWPANGNIGQQFSGRYVFRDPKAGQMVLAYPENLGQPGFEQNPGRQHVERFDLNNQVASTMAVSVQPSDGTETRYLIYRYRITNLIQARQSINSILIPATPLEGKDSISSPANWNGVSSPSKINAMRLGLGKSSGVFLSWYPLDSNRTIAPGMTLDEFRVMTTLRPGLVNAYLQGGSNPALREEMPSVVIDQTVPLLQIENNSQNVPTIAPKFPITIPKAEVARDFDTRIRQLIADKEVDGKSPAITEALNFLQRYPTKLEPKVAFKAQPKPGIEAAIVDAMKLSLNF